MQTRKRQWRGNKTERKTIAKWRARDSTSDQRMGPKNLGSKLLSRDDEAIILGYRWRTRLRLDNCLVKLKRLMPRLSQTTFSTFPITPASA